MWGPKSIFTAEFAATFKRAKHSSRHNTYFSGVGQSHGVVGATGHLCDNLIQQVCRHQYRSHLLIGCSVSQLAVTIMTPGKNRSI